jgi:prepilin signal peptidase PulO-like enzyme (type II secretory pathway)
MLIELGTGACFAALYWHEVIQKGAVPPGALALATPLTLHVQFFSHITLFSLMLVATFIDFDEQTIPDAITLPGTLIGLVFALAFPSSRLLAQSPRLTAEHLTPVTGCRVPNWLEWLGTPASLTIGIACFLAWCCAVIPWLWTTRRGLKKAVQYFCASFLRRLSLAMVIIAVVGTLLIVLTWTFRNAPAASPERYWESLFGALVGMAVGGGLIWAVRIVGGHALGQEAMGFGDVTLMAMIGAFLGWQSTLMIFFLAPFAALFVSVTQWLLTRRRDIAFGPYLCVAACFLVVCWPVVWQRAGPIFGMGMFVPGVLAVGLALMGVMLLGLRWLKETLLGYEDDDGCEIEVQHHPDGSD